MLGIFHLLAEERIESARERGEFDNLPGKGQRLVFEDDSHVNPELRMAFKMLKNAGCIPPEMEEQREIETARELLADMTDEDERYRQIQKLNVLVSKANQRRKRPILLEENEAYAAKATARMSVAGRKDGG